jgi:hypothetical protein
MANRQSCATCGRPIRTSWWPPTTAVVTCRCTTIVKYHDFYSIVGGWAVWGLWVGTLAFWLGTSLLKLVGLIPSHEDSFLNELFGRSAGIGILGAIGSAAVGAIVGSVVSFFLFTGTRGHLADRYERNYRCPICRFAGRLEPSTPWGDAHCPHCNNLLSPR